MKLGLIQMTDKVKSCTDVQYQLALADDLGFDLAYLPKTRPERLLRSQPHRAEHLKIALDVTSFGPLSPSKIEQSVQRLHAQLDGRLALSIRMVGSDAPASDIAKAQTFETMFSYDPRPELSLEPSRYPMTRPRLDVIGLPTSGSVKDVTAAAQRGYFPMTPSWLSARQVARHWPAIVQGATSMMRHACLSHWHVARTIVIHDDPTVLHQYIYGSGSPIRRYFTALSVQGLIGKISMRILTALSSLALLRRFQILSSHYGRLLRNSAHCT